ncbi:hypothetical protein KAT24_00080 [Candidatus Pacearchaeota archaeon]|nr:hypothetical protein [Candidatus Pacearchaeota archaeon]
MTIQETLYSTIFGGMAGALFAASIVFFVFFTVAIYVYIALAWMTIAKKMKCKKYWLAWIPVANFFLLPILLKKKWTWGFMIFVPIANVVFLILWTWKIFELRKYPGWLSLSVLVPRVGGILYLIAIGFVAWKNKKK